MSSEIVTLIVGMPASTKFVARIRGKLSGWREAGDAGIAHTDPRRR
jgi:hypothetical protein